MISLDDVNVNDLAAYAIINEYDDDETISWKGAKAILDDHGASMAEFLYDRAQCKLMGRRVFEARYKVQDIFNWLGY